MTEERNRWIKGKLLSDESISFEISFEAAPYYFPETNICYFGLWRPGKTARQRIVAEFQLGKLFIMPTIRDWELHVLPLMMALKNYSPINIA